MMTANRSRAGTRTRRAIAPMGWAAVVGCLALGPAIGAAAGPGEKHGTYRWHGELVSQDRDTLTIRSRFVSGAGLLDVDGLEAGYPIVITWSGLADHANGVRFVEPLRPGNDRFQLPAEFLEYDPGSQHVTFQVTIPASTVATARVFRSGMWMTVTSPHGSHGADAVAALTRFAAADPSRPVSDPDLYRWHAEFVSLDDAERTVTLRSRIVSQERIAAVRGLTRGEPIAITWSGLGHAANGIRFVERDHARLDAPLRLPAKFVAADPNTRYLTFRVAKPASQPAAGSALTPGDWMTVTSSIEPSRTADAVVMVQAFDATRRLSPSSGTAAAASTTPRTPTYRWHAELVALDRSARTITVKTRVVGRDGLAGVTKLEPSSPIVITWSGFENRAYGIRRVEAAESAIGSADGFQLPAKLVAVDPGTQQLTFTVDTGEGSLIAADTLQPGDWTTVTSPHRLTDQAVVLVDAYDTSRQARRYTWRGELIAFNREDATVAFTAPVEDHVLRYVERFQEGDDVVLVWTPQESDVVGAVRYIEHRGNGALDHGYVLPVEFANADAKEHRILFKTKVPSSTLGTWASIEPGSPVSVTSLFEQRGETAAILVQ